MSSIHEIRYNVIKPFVSFRYNKTQLRNLSDSQKALIRKYYNVLADRTANSNRIYRPRNRNNLKIARQFIGIESDLKFLKAIPVPTPFKDAKISVKNNRLRVRSKHIAQWFVPFDKDELTDRLKEGDDAFVETLIDAFVEQAQQQATQLKATHFTFDNKVSQFNAATIRLLDRHTRRLFERYDNPEQNNFIGNWFEGINLYELFDQADLAEYLRTKTFLRDKNREELKSIIRKNKRRKKKGK